MTDSLKALRERQVVQYRVTSMQIVVHGPHGPGNATLDPSSFFFPPPRPPQSLLPSLRVPLTLSPFSVLVFLGLGRALLVSYPSTHSPIIHTVYSQCRLSGARLTILYERSLVRKGKGGADHWESKHIDAVRGIKYGELLVSWLSGTVPSSCGGLCDPTERGFENLTQYGARVVSIGARFLLAPRSRN